MGTGSSVDLIGPGQRVLPSGRVHDLDGAARESARADGVSQVRRGGPAAPSTTSWGVYFMGRQGAPPAPPIVRISCSIDASGDLSGRL